MRFVLAIAVALVCAPAAVAHTDAGRQLAFAWPAQGTVTSPFGRDGYRWHPGIDIGVLRSLDVTAAAPGRVEQVGEQPRYEGYGHVVLVNVGSGFETLYAHLAAESVRRGDLVATGERLGTAGCTGWCTGTHLHFELRYRGRAVDPTALMPGLN
jgi:murein DD-endopeptidase MepM/ murein hydrolase activator NlpD